MTHQELPRAASRLPPDRRRARRRIWAPRSRTAARASRRARCETRSRSRPESRSARAALAPHRSERADRRRAPARQPPGAPRAPSGSRRSVLHPAPSRRSADSARATDRRPGRRAPKRTPRVNTGRRARRHARAGSCRDTRGSPCRAACASSSRPRAPSPTPAEQRAAATQAAHSSGSGGPSWSGIPCADALAAVLFQKPHIGDHDVVRKRLAHVVDGKRRYACAGQRLHLDAGLVVHATPCSE